MFIIGQIKCSWLLPHRQAICFSSLIRLSRNKSVKKSCFSRIVKNSREFSLLVLDLEAFWFHFSLLKKSESILISLCTSWKRVKAFFFHFALLEKEWKLFIFTFHFSKFKNPFAKPNKAEVDHDLSKLLHGFVKVIRRKLMPPRLPKRVLLAGAHLIYSHNRFCIFWLNCG